MKSGWWASSIGIMEKIIRNAELQVSSLQSLTSIDLVFLLPLEGNDSEVHMIRGFYQTLFPVVLLTISVPKSMNKMVMVPMGRGTPMVM